MSKQSEKEYLEKEIDNYVKKGTIENIFVCIRNDYLENKNIFANGYVNSWDTYLHVLSAVERKLALIELFNQSNQIEALVDNILKKEGDLYMTIDNLQKKELSDIEKEKNSNRKNVNRYICFEKYQKIRSMILEKQINHVINELENCDEETEKATWYCHLTEKRNGPVIVTNNQTKKDAYVKILEKLKMCTCISQEDMLLYLTSLKKNGIRRLPINEDVLMFNF